jgi:hypothetical protein
MILETLIAIVGVASALVTAIVTAIKGIREYKRSIMLRRAEWIYNLYRDFYVQPHLKTVREELDSVEGRSMVEELIRKEVLTREEEKFLSDFTDYLNFFEFIIYLMKMGALMEDDVEAMFDYYLKLFYKSKPIIEYMKKTGYEYLAGYLEEHEGGG